MKVLNHMQSDAWKGLCDTFPDQLCGQVKNCLVKSEGSSCQRLQQEASDHFFKSQRPDIGFNSTPPTTQCHDDVISSINRAQLMSPCSHRTCQLPPWCKLLNKDTAPCRNTLATQSEQACDNHHQYSCLVGNTLLGSPHTTRLAKWSSEIHWKWHQQHVQLASNGSGDTLYNARML